MDIFAAIILGIVQGLTEFLPISSSAHLILIPWILGWEASGVVFDVAVHLGSSVAILAFFWKDWTLLIREVILGILKREPLGNPHRRIGWYLIVGTIPAALAGLTLENLIESRLRSPMITIVMLVVFAVLLYFAERVSRQSRSIEQLSWGDSLWVGVSQAVALVPGVSRSGITVSAAMLRHVTRSSAARFSFLLSTPVIVGAGILQAMRLTEAPQALDWGVLAAGIMSAAITGFLCIRFFLRYVQRHSLLPFVIYRLALALVILILYLRRFY